MMVPRKAYAYIMILAMITVLLVSYILTMPGYAFPDSYHFAGTDYNVLFVVVFWCALAAVSESLTIVLPNGLGVSVGFAIYLASIIIGGPVLAIIVAAASYILSVVKTEDGYSHILNTPYYKVVFNISIFVLSAGSSGIIFSMFSGSEYGVFLFVPTILTVLFYLFINSILMSELIALLHKNAFLPTWFNNFKGVFINIIAIGMIGIILALAFISYGPPAVILFFAPLLLARYSFKLYLNMKHTYIETISAFNKFLEAKDMYTSGHANRVLKYSELLGSAIHLRDDRMENLKNAAILHDIGKIGIDDSILKKPSTLSTDEYMTIKDHVRIGAEIIDGIDFLKGISKIVAQHHERPDGRGYPNGIKASEICIEASILALADVYDAMISDRPYRKGMPVEVAIDEIRKNAGTQFHPELAEIFIDILQKGQLELEDQAADTELLGDAGSELLLAIGRENPAGQ